MLKPDSWHLSCRCTVGPKKWASYETDVECTKPEKFGMYRGMPCIMVKLNRVYGWEPEPYYNTTEVRQQGGESQHWLS